MEARLIRAALLAATVLVSTGASHRTRNFIVQTPDQKQAQRIAQAAERYRRDLAVSWLGKPMPNWPVPCPITVRVGPNMGAGGATTFEFNGGEVYGWQMTIQGSLQRILDSVLPHEITHMIFACHFRRPLPRWADEGGATSVEHSSERTRHHRMLVGFLRSERGIAFNRMFAMREYPRDVMPLYAQGYSLAEYLIQRGGRRKYLAYLADGMRDNHWSAATKRHYGVPDLGALQNGWLAWVRNGCPSAKPPAGLPPQAPPAEMLADAGKLPRPEPNLIYRLRNEDLAAAPDRRAPAKGADPTGANRGWRVAGDRATPPPTAGAVQPPSAVRTGLQLARQQPVQRSEQIVLEWSKPPRGPGYMGPPPQRAAAGASTP